MGTYAEVELGGQDGRERESERERERHVRKMEL